MSYRDEPTTAEAVIADLKERVRRLETALAALPRSTFTTDPDLSPPLVSGTATGDILVWNGATQRWAVLPRGTAGQRLVVDLSAALRVRWVT